MIFSILLASDRNRIINLSATLMLNEMKDLLLEVNI